MLRSINFSVCFYASQCSLVYKYKLMFCTFIWLYELQ